MGSVGRAALEGAVLKMTWRGRCVRLAAAAGLYPPGASERGMDDLASNERRVVRGGSWNNFIRPARCASRNGFNRYNDYGFRVLMGVPI